MNGIIWRATKNPSGWPQFSAQGKLDAQGTFYFCSHWWEARTTHLGFWYVRREDDVPLWQDVRLGEPSCTRHISMPEARPHDFLEVIKPQIFQSIRYLRPTPTFNEQYIRLLHGS